MDGSELPPDDEQVHDTMEDGRPRCQSVAWHGRQCKNAANPDSTTCRWHDQGVAGQLRRQQASRPVFAHDGTHETAEEQGDPNRWAVRCDFVSDHENATRCSNWAMRGLRRCRHHGGAAARDIGEQHMQDRITRHRLRQLADAHGVEAKDAQRARKAAEFNPLAELQSLAIEVIAMKDYLLERVELLRETDWTHVDRIGVDQVSAEVQLYERALERTSRLLVDLGRLNLDERLVKVTERQGDLVAEVLEKVLSQLGLEDDTRQRARAGLAAEFRRLEAS